MARCTSCKIDAFTLERQIQAGYTLLQSANMDRAISTPQPIIVNGCETWYNSAALAGLLLAAAGGGTRDR
jgi:hypothetical protein